jgi:hypothetical protein
MVKVNAGDADGVEHWLLIEWPEAEKEPAHYTLARMRKAPSRKQLVRITKERWRTERAYEDLKGELGLDHYEGLSVLTSIDGVSLTEVDGRLGRRVLERDRESGRASEGQVSVRVVARRSRPRDVGHGVSVAAKGVLQSAGAETDLVCEGKGGGVVARSREVVGEGRVLGEERVCRDVERVLEENDGCELGSEDEVGHRRRGWRWPCGSDSPASHRFLTAVRGGFCAG